MLSFARRPAALPIQSIISDGLPVLVCGSLRYVGRMLPAREFLVARDRYVDLAATLARLGDAPEAATLPRDFHREFLRSVFPESRYEWWAPDPVTLLERNGDAALRAVFATVFAQQSAWADAQLRRAQGTRELESPLEGS